MRLGKQTGVILKDRVYCGKKFAVEWDQIGVMEITHTVTWRAERANEDVKALVVQSCPTLLWPRGLQPTRLLSPWNSPGKNTGVGSHSLLQGIFATQGWKDLPSYKQTLYCLSPLGKPLKGKNTKQRATILNKTETDFYGNQVTDNED